MVKKVCGDDEEGAGMMVARNFQGNFHEEYLGHQVAGRQMVMGARSQGMTKGNSHKGMPQEN